MKIFGLKIGLRIFKCLWRGLKESRVIQIVSFIDWFYWGSINMSNHYHRVILRFVNGLNFLHVITIWIISKFISYYDSLLLYTFFIDILLFFNLFSILLLRILLQNSIRNLLLRNGYAFSNFLT